MSKPDVERLADVMEAFALAKNAPVISAGVGGDRFAGWPLEILAEEVAGSGWRNEPRIAAAIALIRTRHGKLASYGPVVFPPPQTPPRTLPPIGEMLCMRMRCSSLDDMGFQHVAVHRVADTVHVWIITKDAQATTLIDDYALFPSDALVTKLNLLKQE